MEREAARITQIARASAGQGPIALIRIACTATVADEALGPAIAPLLAAHPGLRLDLRLSGGNMDFSRWEADLAIRLGRPAAGAFAVRRLGATRLRLWRGPGGDVAPVCAYREELAGTPEMQALAAAGLAAAPRLRIASLRVIGQVIAGGGVGVLPDHAAHGLEALGAVATPIAARREVGLLIQPHLKDDPLARIVINWIAARVAAICTPAGAAPRAGDTDRAPAPPRGLRRGGGGDRRRVRRGRPQGRRRLTRPWRRGSRRRRGDRGSSAGWRRARRPFPRVGSGS
jgi:DNA-binding transcriptional LysR family regulator